MVRFLWLLLKEGKHVKGVQEVKLYNSDCKWYVLLKQCLLARSLFHLIIFPKDRSIRHVDNRDTSQNQLCYISDKNNKLRRKECLLSDILKSVVIGLSMIFFWSFNSRNIHLFISIVGSTEQKYGDVMISFSIRMEKQRLDLLFCKRNKEFESDRLYRSLINAEINSFVRWENKSLFFLKRDKIGRDGGRPIIVGS